MIGAGVALMACIFTLLVCLHRTAEHQFFRRPRYYQIICVGALVSLVLLLPPILPYSSDEKAALNLFDSLSFMLVTFGPFSVGCLARAALFLLRLRWPNILPDYSQSNFFTVFITGSALAYIMVLGYIVSEWNQPTW